MNGVCFVLEYDKTKIKMRSQIRSADYILYPWNVLTVNKKAMVCQKWRHNQLMINDPNFPKARYHWFLHVSAL